MSFSTPFTINLCIVNGVEKDNSYLVDTEGKVQIVDNALFTGGNNTIQLQAVDDGYIISPIYVDDVYKYLPITDLAVQTTKTGAKNELALTFSKVNVLDDENDTDKVYLYRLIFTNKSDTSLYTTIDVDPTQSVSNNISISCSWDDKYTLRLPHDVINSIVRVVGNEFYVSVVELGDNKYLENLVVNTSNKKELMQIAQQNYGDIISITEDGLMNIKVVEQEYYDDNNVLDTLMIRFVSGEDEYVYIDTKYSTREENYEVDFTTHTVTNNNTVAVAIFAIAK